MNAIESPNDSAELLALHRASFLEFQCRTMLLPEKDSLEYPTMCVLPKGHDDCHQGVQLFVGRRSIAWDA